MENMHAHSHPQHHMPLHAPLLARVVYPSFVSSHLFCLASFSLLSRMMMLVIVVVLVLWCAVVAPAEHVFWQAACVCVCVSM